MNTCKHFLKCLITISYVLTPALANAQIAPDTTLPVNSTIIPNGNTLTINGGTTAGSNLFHSFTDFNVTKGTSVVFNNAATIQNILTRVTGGRLSDIEGSIRANGSANLFLLNPAGIIFGPNASLNIGGSFIGSTANSINFADGTSFNAKNPHSSPLLTISVPVGLNFSSNPGAIQVTGSSSNPTNLQVNPGQTLALVGGDVTLIQGNLTAPTGRIELGSVQSGTVALNPNSSGWSLNYQGIDNFGNISLSGLSSADVSGNGGGTIQVQGQRVTLSDGSSLVAMTSGKVDGGTINVNASELLELTGTSADALNLSGLFAYAANNSTGNAGTINVKTNQLQVKNGAQILSDTFGQGNGGSINITAHQVEFTGTSADGNSLSGLFANAERGSTGNAGSVNLTTNSLRIADGAQLNSGTFGPGNGGSVNVNAHHIEVTGTSANGRLSSGLSANAERDSTGNAGNVNITTDSILVTNAGQINSNTLGSGNGGSLNINANSIELIGNSTSGAVSGLFTDAAGEQKGNAGDINLTTNSLRVIDGAQIDSVAFTTGNAGNININARQVELIGSSADNVYASGLITATLGSIGNGGNIHLNTDELRVINGAIVFSGTFGPGNAGNIDLVAKKVELIGFNSGLFANAISGTGNGGDIKVATNDLVVRDRATITVGNFSSSDPSVTPGTGAAGNIEIATNSLTLDNSGTLSSSTAAGSKGSINLQSQLLVLRHQSAIEATANGLSNGGNITINTDTIAQLENSKIIADADLGKGGNIQITTQGLFQSPDSTITAKSSLAINNGVVEIHNPNIDTKSGLIKSPTTVIDSTSQITASCPATKGNHFAVTGHGGLPENPTSTLLGQTVWSDLRPVAGREITHSRIQPKSPLPTLDFPLIEATGFIRDEQGKISLILNHQMMPPQPWQKITQCRDLRAS